MTPPVRGDQVAKQLAAARAALAALEASHGAGAAREGGIAGQAPPPQEAANRPASR